MVTAFLGMVLLGTPPVFDHAVDFGATSIYMDEKYHHGAEMSYEGKAIFESHSWIVRPRQMHFHDKSFIYSIECGPEIPLENVKIGIKAAYDLSTMSGYTFQQKSIGFELSNEDIEVSVRHYAPWPSTKLEDGFVITPYAHTDLDIIHKFGQHKVGFAPYHIEGKVGLKGHLEVVISQVTISAQWRYDDFTKHTATFGVSIGVFAPKSISKHSPLIFTKSVAASLPPKTMLTPQKPPLSDIVVNTVQLVDEKKK